MLKQEFRLRRPRDIERVYKRGVYGGGGQLYAKATPSHLAHSRAVIVVGKKISKKAVVRNTIRRRLAAQLAELWGTIPPGYDIVIVVREDLTKATPAELKKQLQTGLSRSGVLVKPKT